MEVEVVRGLVQDLVVEQPATLYRAGVLRDPLARVEVGSGRRNPYPVYEEIRARGPLLSVVRWGAVTVDHALCRAVLHDRRWSVRGDTRPAATVSCPSSSSTRPTTPGYGGWPLRPSLPARSPASSPG